MIFDLLQLIGGIVLSVGFIPQIIQILKTKSVRDLNSKTFVMSFIGISFMEIYAINLVINGSGLMFLITNTMSLIISSISAGLIIKYKK
jgi:MtN3 and saliva related transmembrane protein